MYARVPARGHTAVSAIWNAAYDAGMGVGAIGVGLVAGHTGYPAVFLLTGALTLTALAPAVREHATGRPRRRTSPGPRLSRAGRKSRDHLDRATPARARAGLP
jgi:hypothetical protein